MTETRTRTVCAIASDIRRAWGTKVNYAAAPYLEAMSCLGSVDDEYGADSGRSIVRYFLSNASSFRGEAARELKSELRNMLGGPR